jgi:dTDP-4-dehydrorhamnose reductase
MVKKSDTILITGCGGMLGEGVYKRFKDVARVVATDIDLNESWLSHLDVRDKKEVDTRLAEIKPNIIVHLAAHTDMEYCERNPVDSFLTNEYGVLHFGDYVRRHEVPFVYISTAGIFDGTKDAYHEDDVANPLSVYGKSKYTGEVIAKTFNKHIVTRAGWMMGGGPKKDKKFINKIIKQVKNGTKELKVVNDKLGTPCYTYDLANVIYELLNKEAWGVYHGACKGEGSRADVARHLLKSLGRGDIQVTEVDSNYFKTDYYAPRPRSEILLNTKLTTLGLDAIRDWKICVEEYTKKFAWEE